MNEMIARMEREAKDLEEAYIEAGASMMRFGVSPGDIEALEAARVAANEARKRLEAARRSGC